MLAHLLYKEQELYQDSLISMPGPHIKANLSAEAIPAEAARDTRLIAGSLLKTGLESLGLLGTLEY